MCECTEIPGVHICILISIQNASVCKETCEEKDIKMLTGTWEDVMVVHF